jgi:hypothetical protein
MKDQDSLDRFPLFCIFIIVVEQKELFFLAGKFLLELKKGIWVWVVYRDGFYRPSLDGRLETSDTHFAKALLWLGHLRDLLCYH